MDEPRGSRPDDTTPADPSEGVRIIGAEEAAEAMERGDVAPRRTDDELRFGDRPPAPPAGPRPALRFPLDASADPSRIERPPVEPPPEPVTGPLTLPHWTEPPTGEVPAVLVSDDSPLIEEDEDDLEAWSSFATAAPRWRDADDDWGDDGFVEHLAGDSGEVRVGALDDQEGELSHEEYFGFEDMDERVEERTGDTTGATAVAGGEGDEHGWADEHDDWSASDEGLAEDWPADEEWGDVEEPAAAAPSGAAPAGVRTGTRAPATAGGGGRNVPTAAAVGIGLAVAFLVALKVSTGIAALFVAVILFLCSVEYFRVLRQVGWEAATLVGEVTCFALPLAVYWRGPVAIPLVLFLATVATLAWYLVGAGGADPRVLEGSGATLLGIVWIGALGSVATAMLRGHDGAALLLTAILATVAHDVVGFFSGRAVGHRPLSTASPNKTIEGLAFAMGAAFLVTVIWVGILGMGPWDGIGAGLVLGIGAAVMAPLGDLCQSLLKRDLGVKDMGDLLPGHGGVLDRFDAMLFVLPTVFWLVVTLGNGVIG
jgi:phosphatidate cytidylyltransferase